MGAKKLLVLLSVFAAIYLGSSQRSLRFCHYNDVASHADTMSCSNVVAESDLEDDLQLSTFFNIKQLVISNSSMRFFKHTTFRNTKFEVILVKNCSLLSLTDTDVAFEGLEDHLQKLYIQNSSMVNHLDWYHLRNLKKLTMLTISGSDLDYVDRTLSLMSSSANLMSLNLKGNHISWVHPKAFSTLKNISAIRMGHNAITSLQRSMFSETPSELTVLDFSYNLLHNLPSDIFSNMNALNMLNLEGNQLMTMDEKVFGDKINNFLLLILIKNPLRCDCRMKWLTKVELEPSKVRAFCNEPSSLFNVSVTALKARDLWC